MKNNYLKKCITATALSVAKITTNGACVFLFHQPNMPKQAKKLRKF